MAERILCNDSLEIKLLAWFVECLILIPTLLLELVADHSTRQITSSFKRWVKTATVALWFQPLQPPVIYSITWSSVGLKYGWQMHSSMLTSSRWLQKHNCLGCVYFSETSLKHGAYFISKRVKCHDSPIPILMLFYSFVTEAFYSLSLRSAE